MNYAGVDRKLWKQLAVFNSLGLATLFPNRGNGSSWSAEIRPFPADTDEEQKTRSPLTEAEKFERLNGRMRKRTRELVVANRSLQESEERYRELVSNMPNGVLVYKKGRIVFANAYILSIVGCSLDEIIGKSVLDFIHPDDREIVEKNMALRLADKACGPRVRSPHRRPERRVAHRGRSRPRTSCMTMNRPSLRF